MQTARVEGEEGLPAARERRGEGEEGVRMPKGTGADVARVAAQRSHGGESGSHTNGWAGARQWERDAEGSPSAPRGPAFHHLLVSGRALAPCRSSALRPARSAAELQSQV